VGQEIANGDGALGRHGCPWDRKQTLASLKPYVIE
jgi:uncharacterized protein YabN with tetrapyrrole methylase and pyrophosphatase domain